MFHKGKHESAVDLMMPILILLNLNMPIMDGHKVLEILKSNKIFRKIPIIILTTSDSENNIDLCLEKGANSYIVKPMDYDDLVCCIEKLQDFCVDIAWIPLVN